MAHRLIDHIQADADGSTVITLVNGARYRLDQERRQVFRDDLTEELEWVDADRSIFSDGPPPDPNATAGTVSLIYRSSASPLVYVLSTPDGDFDMSAGEAKAILFER